MPTPPPAFERPFGAVLLDMDGTLVDSIDSVVRSWVRWCAEYGVDPERLRGNHGVTAWSLVTRLLPEELRAEAYARIRELEVADAVTTRVLPGAAELLGRLKDGRVPTAIVTSSTDDLAEARLRASALPHPDVLVTASDVARGKPHPDPWLEGARRLGVDPGECLVVEDAVAGLTAARAAGCRGLVAVTSTTPVEELEPVADLVVRDVAVLGLEAAGGLARIVPWP